MTNIVKNNDKEKRVYSGYGKAFDGASSWNFGVDNSSSSHADNCKNNFLVLGKGLTY